MDTKPQAIAQPTISEVLQQFLDDQGRRLKPRTFASLSLARDMAILWRQTVSA